MAKVHIFVLYSFDAEDLSVNMFELSITWGWPWAFDHSAFTSWVSAKITGRVRRYWWEKMGFFHPCRHFSSRATICVQEAYLQTNRKKWLLYKIKYEGAGEGHRNEDVCRSHCSWKQFNFFSLRPLTCVCLKNVSWWFWHWQLKSNLLSKDYYLFIPGKRFMPHDWILPGINAKPQRKLRAKFAQALPWLSCL